MIRINLLAAERPTTSRSASVASAPGAMQAYLILGLCAGGALAACLVLYWMKSTAIAELDTKIKQEEALKAQLQEVKKRVDELKAKEADLETKKKVLEDLKAAKGTSVRMLDEISKALPEYLWLTSMDQTANKLDFSGQAASMTAVADFMNRLGDAAHPGGVCKPGDKKPENQHCWFPEVELSDAKETANLVTFKLTAIFKFPPPPKKAEDENKS